MRQLCLCSGHCTKPWSRNSAYWSALISRIPTHWPCWNTWQETFSLPAAPQGTALIVHAEIYPTPVLGLAKAAGIEVSAQVAGLVNDAQQVWACAALARHEDDNGTLMGRFAKSRMLRDGQVDQAREEGWILWA